MEQEVFEMGVAVVLACLVMAIGGIYQECELLCPFHDVVVQAEIPPSWMMAAAVRCMADTRARPSRTPLSRMMRSTSLVMGIDFFARFGVEGEIGGMGFHETIPPRAVQRSMGEGSRLLPDRRFSPPVKANPLFAKSSFNIAIMAAHHT